MLKDLLLLCFPLFLIHPALHAEEAPPDEFPVDALVEEMMSEIPPLPLPLLIEAISGFEVIDWKGEDRERLEAAAQETIELINQEGVGANRVNEVGNYVEEYIKRSLENRGFKVATPMAQNGRRRSTGYPDLEVFDDDTFLYIEVKTYNPKNVNTTQRSFYLSPSTNPKITRDAYHLLIAFAMQPHPDKPKTWTCERVKFLDLYNLTCNIKFEFNASNRDLYSKEAGLVFFDSAE
jgi:hypothetical protein